MILRVLLYSNTPAVVNNETSSHRALVMVPSSYCTAIVQKCLEDEKKTKQNQTNELGKPPHPVTVESVQVGIDHFGKMNKLFLHCEPG